MINAILVDDESFASDSLVKLLHHYCPDVNVMSVANSVETAIETIKVQQPDLVFLDIHLAKDTSFSILESFDEIPFSIIFTSGHSDYGVDAFKVNAIDYLLKPVDSDDLIMAVEKFRNWKALNSAKNGLRKAVQITVHVKDRVEILNSDQIYSLVANDNYTDIFIADKTKHTIAKTLKTMEEALEEDEKFIRIHRSVLVNSEFIENYSKQQPFVIELTNGLTYEISRRKRAEVIATLKIKS